MGAYIISQRLRKVGRRELRVQQKGDPHRVEEVRVAFLSFFQKYPELRSKVVRRSRISDVFLSPLVSNLETDSIQ